MQRRHKHIAQGAGSAGKRLCRLAPLRYASVARNEARAPAIPRISATALILVLSLALHTPGLSACTVPEGFARLSSPEAEIAYRWEPSVLKVGQFFAAEVVACRAPAPGAVSAIVLDAQMPAHGHGMNYRPTVTSTGPGRFRFAGLMLHMPGTWRLTFDLVQSDRRTRLAQEVTLRP